MNSADRVYADLIDPIEDRMIACIMRVVRHSDDAADVLQEVRTEIWRRLGKLLRHPNPHAYILRMCFSRSYDAMRRRRKQRQREIPLEEAPATLACHPSERKSADDETCHLIREAIASLPAKQGQSMLLRFLEGESYQGIADALECSEATARSHVSKGKAALQVLLEQAGILQGNGERS